MPKPKYKFKIRNIFYILNYYDILYFLWLLKRNKEENEL